VTAVDERGRGPERDETDVGEYCRRVEAHLTQVNGGHLVRIVGPGFEVVRRWAVDGVPLSIVRRGIERKAERHRHGSSTRPLRIEFCEADVRDVYEEWRRAIGVPTGTDAGDEEVGPSRKPSLPRHIGRALERLGRLTGRMEWPDELRDGVEACRSRLLALQASAAGARGEARAGIVARLEELDRDLLDVARRAAPDEIGRALEREAEADLAPYRGRLSDQLWQASVEVTIRRLLRDRLGLPTIEIRS